MFRVLVLKDRIFPLEDTASFPLNYQLLLPPCARGIASKKVSHLPRRGNWPWSPGGGMTAVIQQKREDMCGVQEVHLGALS